MSNKILPARTRPHAGVIARVHAPTVETWGNFLDCLRWEFGFTCAICLLHEHDFVLPGTGVSRTGQFSIEHKVLKSTPAGEVIENDYANCLYLCRFCNGTRGDRHAHVAPEGRLLDPVADRWDAHFAANDDSLTPLPNDGDAAYTERAYGINDGNRRERRGARARLIEALRRDLLARVEDIRAVDVELQGSLSVEARGAKMTQRGRWRVEAEGIVEKLKDFLGVPRDAPPLCKCRKTSTRRTVVPAVVEACWEELPLLAIGDAPGAPARRLRE
ncbi:MAG: hypothetical protein U0324_45025 [Polyangiales bacterium]